MQKAGSISPTQREWALAENPDFAQTAALPFDSVLMSMTEPTNQVGKVLLAPQGFPAIPALAKTKTAFEPVLRAFVLRPQTMMTTNGLLLGNRPGHGAPIQPGVYQSYPYSCLVLVPSAQPDDKCIVAPGGTDPRMPMIKPDLRLIPRKLP
jgi:hypothetical protein